jgi:hypothetical protein
VSETPARGRAPLGFAGRVQGWLGGERAVLLGFLLLAALVIVRSLLPGRVFYFRDVHQFWFPSIEGFVRAVGGGEWPLWDPSFNFGKPILADPGIQAAYPPTWLNLVLLPGTYYELFLLAHLVWAGYGGYRLALHWGLPRLASWTSGAVFACSGPVVSALSLWHHFAATAWLPWVLLALERLLARPGPRRAAWLGVAAAGQALTGSADLCLMTAALCALRVAAGWPRGRFVRLLASAALALVLAAGLAAVQWLPTLATLAGSSRSEMGSESFSYWSLHPFQLVELVFPLPTSGFALTRETRRLLFEGRESFLTSIHPGTAALGMAALGALLPGGRPRLRLGLWLGLTLCAVAALGRHGPLQPLIGALPGFDMVRYPQKFMLPASLLFGAAAGCGVAAWQDRWSPRQSRVGRRVAVAGALLALGLAAAAARVWWSPRVLAGMVTPDLLVDAAALVAPALATSALTAGLWSALLLTRSARSESEPRLVGGAVAVALAQLVLAGVLLSPGAPGALVTQRPSLLEPLSREPAPVRLQAVAAPLAWVDEHLSRSPHGWDAGLTRALGRVQALQPPIPARWGVDGAYWGTFTGQEPLAYTNLTGLAYQRRDAVGSRLLAMGGVTHVVSVEERPYPDLDEIASVESVFDVPIRLFRVSSTLPRAYAVEGLVVADEPLSYEVVQDPAFDPAHSVIVARGEPRAPREGFRAVARTLWRRSASVGVEAELSREGTLVLLEAWDPGWTVEVDGEPRPLLRVNLLFRGVALEGGRQRVVFRYRPREAVTGFWMTLVSAAAAVALATRREA